jgi:hypothetical protein
MKAFIDAFFVSNPWKPHARDARGKLLPLHNLSQYWLRGTKAGGLSSIAFSRIRERLIAAGFKKGLGPPTMVSLLLVSFFFGASVWLFWYSRSPRYLPVMFAGSGLLQVFVAATRRYRIPLADEQALMQTFLNEELCPACAFSLANSPTAKSGSIICTECGAHWNRPTGSHPN